MDRTDFIKQISKKLRIDEDESATILNEILAIRVVPSVFRNAAVQRIANVSTVDKDKAELAVNEFVGTLTSRAALFEEVVEAFGTAAIKNECDVCRDCFNCGKEAFQDMLKSDIAVTPPTQIR